MIETHKSFCRFCHAACGIEVDVENGRPVAVRGDRENALSRGYLCIKGHQLIAQHESPERLRGSVKRLPDGSFESIPSEQGLDEVADRLREIIDRDGPGAIAVYSGTHGLYGSGARLIQGWTQALETPYYFTPNTIDQSSQYLAWARHGSWHAGIQTFRGADVALFAGNNPGVSAYAQSGGPMFADAFRHIKEAQRAGTRIIAIDPRRSELAARADIHLAVKPGEDPTLLAGMVRIILEERLYDEAFASAHLDGIEQLRRAVADFTPEYVAERARVPVADLEAAARLFARGPRGPALAGTGVNMAPRPDVTQHFIVALNSLCGRFLREGEVVPNPGVLGPPSDKRAEVIPPAPLWGKGPKSRFRGLGHFMNEMPVNVFADEALTPGKGQIRALLCIGGNPAVAFPDQRKVVRALRGLELLAVVDVKMTATAKLAHHVFGARLSLEKPSTTLPTELFNLDFPWAQHSPALIEPDFDVIEEWEFIHGLGRRLGTRLPLAGGGELDPAHKPTPEAYLDVLHTGSRVPLEEVRRHPGGHTFSPPEPQRVLPGRQKRANVRMDVAPEAVLSQLREIRGEAFAPAAGGYHGDEGFSHRLISRRMMELYNSTGDHLPKLLRQFPYNPAFMNPECMDELGIASGEVVRIDSEHDFIHAVVQAEAGVPRGVVSMAHARGDLPDRDHEVVRIGSSTNRLVANDRDFNPVNGMPRQSAIPVTIRPLTAADRA